MVKNPLKSWIQVVILVSTEMKTVLYLHIHFIYPSKYNKNLLITSSDNLPTDIHIHTHWFNHVLHGKGNGQY